MNHTDLEVKLIRHAFDLNSEGEAGNAAAMFFKELRKRGIKAHEFLETGGATPAANSSSEFERKFNNLLAEFHQVIRERDEVKGEASRACTRASDEYSKRFFAEQNLRRCQAELMKCQQELKIAQQQPAKLRRESSLWSGLVRSVTG